MIDIVMTMTYANDVIPISSEYNGMHWKGGA